MASEEKWTPKFFDESMDGHLVHAEHLYECPTDKKQAASDVANAVRAVNVALDVARQVIIKAASKEHDFSEDDLFGATSNRGAMTASIRKLDDGLDYLKKP